VDIVYNESAGTLVWRGSGYPLPDYDGRFGDLGDSCLVLNLIATRSQYRYRKYDCDASYPSIYVVFAWRI